MIYAKNYFLGSLNEVCSFFRLGHIDSTSAKLADQSWFRILSSIPSPRLSTQTIAQLFIVTYLCRYQDCRTFSYPQVHSRTPSAFSSRYDLYP
jgi:hypothetical protein